MRVEHCANSYEKQEETTAGRCAASGLLNFPFLILFLLRPESVGRAAGRVRGNLLWAFSGVSPLDGRNLPLIFFLLFFLKFGFTFLR